MNITNLGTALMTRTVLAYAALGVIVLSQLCAADDGLGLFVRGGYTYARPAAGLINEEVDDTNKQATANGVSDFGLPHLSSMWGPQFVAGVRFNPKWDLGIAYNFVANELSASGKVTGTTTTASGRVNLSADFILLRPYFFFLTEEPLRAYVSPAFGIGMFGTDSNLTVGTTSTGRTTGNTAVAFGGFVGADYMFLPSLGVGIEAGYLYAKSGALKIESKSGTSTAVVGETEKYVGKDAVLDLSGPRVALNLIFRLDLGSSHSQGVSAAAPAAASAPTTPSTGSSNLEDKLKQLENMRKQGLLTEDEYKQKRKELLDKFQ